MPPQAKITKEMILNTVLDITRATGSETVNARSIASRLKCSTRPIFTCKADIERSDPCNKTRRDYFCRICHIWRMPSWRGILSRKYQCVWVYKKWIMILLGYIWNTTLLLVRWKILQGSQAMRSTYSKNNIDIWVCSFDHVPSMNSILFMKRNR